MLNKIKNFNIDVEKNLLYFISIIIFVFILFRNSGLYSLVFSDEYYYSDFSRIIKLVESTVPNYLYLFIYRATNNCGDGFYNCARIFNAIFFVASMPFIYFTAKKTCNKIISIVITSMALIGPINIYTAFYMPESLYFLSFWMLTWYVLRIEDAFDIKSSCFTGILLGVSTLIKPHALFLLPTLVTYIVYLDIQKKNKWMFQSIKNLIYFIFFVLSTKFLIGYLFAGKAGITLFGPLYTSMANNGASDFQRFLDLLIPAAKSFKGHALGICIMFGLPIACLFNAFFNLIIFRGKEKSNQNIYFYTSAILVNLIIVVVFFTALAATAGGYETIERIHMRYYNFALPLLLIVTGSQLFLNSKTNLIEFFKWRIIAAFPIAGVILYAIYVNISPYIPTLVDSPELRGFTFNATVFYVLGFLSFIVLVLWIYTPKIGAKLFIFVFMPLSIIYSTYYVNQELRQRIVPDVYDKAGIFTKQYLPNEDLSKLIVVGSDPASLFRTSFYIDNHNVSREIVSVGASYDLTKVPSGRDWALVIGEHPINGKIFFELPMSGFSLVCVTCTNTVDFRKKSWPGVISRTQGLSSAEGWGTWSSGNVVTIEFLRALPDKFTVHLTGHAFGPNAKKEFIAHIEDSAVQFTLDGSDKEILLEFRNPMKSKILKIDIPFPTSPKELGLSEDNRKLGIAFAKLRIE